MDALKSAEFWIAVTVLVLFLAAAYAIKGYLRRLVRIRCCGGGGAKTCRQARVRDKNPNHYSYRAVLTIDGMACDSCTQRIENALNRMEGVWATVDFLQKQAVVYMKCEVSGRDLRAAISGLSPYTVLKIEQTAMGGVPAERFMPHRGRKAMLCAGLGPGTAATGLTMTEKSSGTAPRIVI